MASWARGEGDNAPPPSEWDASGSPAAENDEMPPEEAGSPAMRPSCASAAAHARRDCRTSVAPSFSVCPSTMSWTHAR